MEQLTIDDISLSCDPGLTIDTTIVKRLKISKNYFYCINTKVSGLSGTSPLIQITYTVSGLRYSFFYGTMSVYNGSGTLNLIIPSDKKLDNLNIVRPLL